jgi:hypothetical protein
MQLYYDPANPLIATADFDAVVVGRHTIHVLETDGTLLVDVHERPRANAASTKLILSIRTQDDYTFGIEDGSWVLCQGTVQLTVGQRFITSKTMIKAMTLIFRPLDRQVTNDGAALIIRQILDRVQMQDVATPLVEYVRHGEWTCRLDVYEDLDTDQFHRLDSQIHQIQNDALLLAQLQLRYIEVEFSD